MLIISFPGSGAKGPLVLSNLIPLRPRGVSVHLLLTLKLEHTQGAELDLNKIEKTLNR